MAETTLMTLRPSRLFALHYYVAWLVLWILAAIAFFDPFNVIVNWQIPLINRTLQGVGAALLGFLGLLALLAAELKRLRTQYVVTDARIVRFDGILRRRSQQMPFTKVERVELDQGIIQRILRLGDISLDTGEDNIVFEDLGRVTRVQDEISRQIAERGKQ